jgi:hypothetical protein
VTGEFMKDEDGKRPVTLDCFYEVAIFLRALGFPLSTIKSRERVIREYRDLNLKDIDNINNADK